MKLLAEQNGRSILLEMESPSPETIALAMGAFTDMVRAEFGSMPEEAVEPKPVTEEQLKKEAAAADPDSIVETAHAKTAEQMPSNWVDSGDMEKSFAELLDESEKAAQEEDAGKDDAGEDAQVLAAEAYEKAAKKIEEGLEQRRLDRESRVEEIQHEIKVAEAAGLTPMNYKVGKTGLLYQFYYICPGCKDKGKRFVGEKQKTSTCHSCGKRMAVRRSVTDDVPFPQPDGYGNVFIGGDFLRNDERNIYGHLSNKKVLSMYH